MVIVNIYIVFPVIIVSVIAIIVYFLKNPEKIDKWSYLFYKFLHWHGEKREKRLISSNLDYKISTVAKRINNEAQGIIPYGIRIKWKTPNEVISYVQKNEVVVVLKKEENLDKNIIEACTAFVPQALLPKARNCVDPEIVNSMDHYMIKKILNEGDYDSAYNYFMTNVLQNKLNTDANFKEITDDISQLDSLGFFTRIMLEEFRRLGSHLYGTKEEDRYKTETIDFLHYLRKFHQRKPGDKIKLDFIGDKIKICVCFVAKKSTLNRNGIKTHLKYIDQDYKNGIHRIFIFSFAQSYDKSIYDEQGYVKSVKKQRDFTALNQLESECRKIDYLRLIKKQKYFTKDLTGRRRFSKYLLYETIK